MPYKCLNCGEIFIKPKIIHTSYEDYYGVSGLFSSRTSLELEICPKCDDEEVEEFDEDEEDYEEDEGE